MRFVSPTEKIRSGPFSQNTVYVLVRAAPRHQPVTGLFYGEWSQFVEYVSTHSGKTFPFDNATIFHGFATTAEALEYWKEIYGEADPDILPAP